jgi:hypothetical protein
MCPLGPAGFGVFQLTFSQRPPVFGAVLSRKLGFTRPAFALTLLPQINNIRYHTDTIHHFYHHF